MKKTKAIALLLAGSMTMMSLAGCGGKEAAEETTKAAATTAAAAAATTAAAAAEPEVEKPLYPLVDTPVTLKGVYIGTNQASSNTREAWDKVAEVTGITIEWECIEEAALPTLLASNDWPDLFHGVISSSIEYDYGVLGGRFVNYRDYLDIMPHLVKTMEDYPVAAKATVLSNGAMYHPARIDNSVTAVYVRPYVDTSVLEEAGVAMPTTVDEFEQALRDLKEYYGVVNFIPRLDAAVNTWGMMLYAAFGTGCDQEWDVDDNGQVYFAGMSDQMRHYYEYMNRLYEQGLIHPEAATIDQNTAKALELEGNVAFLDYAASSVPADENGEWHISCVPPLTSEYDSTREVLGRTFVNNDFSIWINNDSEYVEELCRLVDIFYATEEVVEGTGLYGAASMQGLEGVHWDYTEDGQSYVQHLTPEYEGKSANTFTACVVKWCNFGRGDALAGKLTNDRNNSYSRQIGFRDNVFPYTSPDPFPKDYLTFTEDQQFVLDNTWTEIDTYVKKMRIEFMTGVTDIESGWDTYLATLDKMGVQDVIKVYQEAYEAYLSK